MVPMQPNLNLFTGIKMSLSMSIMQREVVVMEKVYISQLIAQHPMDIVIKVKMEISKCFNV
jgi:hypothetical protein